MDRHKFPRTPHFPTSPGWSGDDERLVDLSHFENKTVVATTKLDGENSTIYSDGYIHARSMDSHSSPWQTWLKNFMADKFYRIPSGWRIVGENMYAIHSIEYQDLESFFYMFGCVDENNVVQSWDIVQELAKELGLLTPYVYTIHEFSTQMIKTLSQMVDYNSSRVEGFVVRNIEEFRVEDYGLNVAKYVRKDHVQTDEHWTHNWKPARLGT